MNFIMCNPLFLQAITAVVAAIFPLAIGINMHGQSIPAYMFMWGFGEIAVTVQGFGRQLSNIYGSPYTEHAMLMISFISFYSCWRNCYSSRPPHKMQTWFSQGRGGFTTAETYGRDWENKRIGTSPYT